MLLAGTRPALLRPVPPRPSPPAPGSPPEPPPSCAANTARPTLGDDAGGATALFVGTVRDRTALVERPGDVQLAAVRLDLHAFPGDARQLGADEVRVAPVGLLHRRHPVPDRRFTAVFDTFGQPPQLTAQRPQAPARIVLGPPRTPCCPGPPWTRNGSSPDSLCRPAPGAEAPARRWWSPRPSTLGGPGAPGRRA